MGGISTRNIGYHWGCIDKEKIYMESELDHFMKSRLFEIRDIIIVLDIKKVQANKQAIKLS